MTLPKELWISAAKIAVKINPANAPAVHQLRHPNIKLIEGEPNQTLLYPGKINLSNLLLRIHVAFQFKIQTQHPLFDLPACCFC